MSVNRGGAAPQLQHMSTLTRQLEQVQKFLYGWLVEGGPDDSLAPGRVVSLWGLSRSQEIHPDKTSWEVLQAVDSAVEDWAIDLSIGTSAIDETYPDAPWGDNVIRKLMLIRGSARA